MRLAALTSRGTVWVVRFLQHIDNVVFSSQECAAQNDKTTRIETLVSVKQSKHIEVVHNIRDDEIRSL